MPVHLTARITWHDSANNGAICRDPLSNVACRGHDWIAAWFADQKNAKQEQEAATKEVASLDWRPPCWRDVGAFGASGFVATHKDPLEGRGLPTVDEEIPAYSLCPSPYRYMLEGNFDDICRDENLQIRGKPDADRHSTWVMEADRQKALLDHFWGKIEKGKSLVFFYHNQQNAVDDFSPRLLAGVARISKLGPQRFFGFSPKTPGNFPVWSRCVTHSWPSEGVRIPYHEYIAAGKDPAEIACTPPADTRAPFKYVAEHMSDGQAVSTIAAIIRTIEKVRDDKIARGNWGDALSWLDATLDECWSGRGAFPGIGAVLRYLGCDRGVAFQHDVLSKLERNGTNVWEHTKAILSGVKNAPAAYAEPFAPACAKWRQIPTRHELLSLLVKIELTDRQVAGVADEAERGKRGIQASPSAICENPYLLSEQDHGTNNSDAITLEAVDQAVLPEGDAARFQAARMAVDDPKRVRATAQTVLRLAADAGDTVLPLPELVSRIRSYFPERRACPADGEAFWSDEQRTYHGKILWLKELAQVDDTQVREQPEAADEFSEDLDRDDGASASPLRLVGLKRVRADEDAVASFIRKAGPLKPSNISEPNWQVLLRDEQRGGFPKPASERGRRALEEKERALHALWSEKLSVLTGGAGTGKTSVVRVFLEGMRDAEGARTLLLTAPTGKARVRLETKTQRRAKTIHQVLYDAGLLEEGYRVRREPTKAKSRYETIIVDEASMPSVELLAALLRAIEVERIRRFILVGDPHQLPPIGPGRPFFDAIRWLRQNRPKAIAELATSMRISTADDGSEVPSFGLSLAAAFRAEKTPGDDEVFSELASRGKVGDTTLHLWKDTDDLETAILNALASDLPKQIKTDKDFDLALGIPPYEKKKGTDGKIDARKAESWQLLSPNRILGHGSDRLNRLIQGHFRSALLSQARDWRSRWPRPFGDTEIVFHDKVLQAVNTPKWLPKDAKGLRFVANGEIGIVEEAWKGSDRGPDNVKVRFSTQPDCLYGYKRREVDEEGQLELAYALTVHKAQGSDFESVILIIPKAAGNLSRELIYTGLTRFTDKLILLVQEDMNSLLRHRDVIASDTIARTTMLFEFAPGVKSRPTEDVYAPYRPEGLIHRTSTGVAVRSKSEIVVADVLTHLGLSWTYEEPLKGKSGSSNDFRIPDFTIRNGGETWYWEHLGMLDRADYQARWEKKKAWYEANGYAQQLITSEESATEGLRADLLGNIAETRILKGN